MPIYSIHHKGRQQYTVPNVLAAVALAGVETTNGSNVIAHTALSGSAVYPGMSVRIPGIPLGSFIAAIKDSTHLELACSTWDAATGIGTTLPANAQATSAGTISGLSGYALGYDPLCVIMQFLPLGTWRNEVGSTSLIIPTYASWAASSGNTAGAVISGPGTVAANAEVTAATWNTATPGAVTLTPTYGAKSDSYATTPTKRHNWEPYGVRLLFSTGGHVSDVPADRDWTVRYYGADV